MERYAPLNKEDIMSIKKETIELKKKELQTSFDTLANRISQMEKELGKMKSDLNAVAGAIQVCDQFLSDVTEEMSKEKAAALNMATS